MIARGDLMTVLKARHRAAALLTISALTLLLGPVLPSTAVAQSDYYTDYTYTYLNYPTQALPETLAESISNSGLVGGSYEYSYQDTDDYEYAGFIYSAGAYTGFRYPYFPSCTPPGCTFDVS